MFSVFVTLGSTARTACVDVAEDGSVYDLRTAVCREFGTEPAEVTRLALGSTSLDDATLLSDTACVAGMTFTLHLGDPTHLRPTRYRGTKDCTCLALSHCGRHLALGYPNGTFTLNDTTTGLVEATFPGGRVPLMALCFSPCGGWMYLASRVQVCRVAMWACQAEAAVQTPAERMVATTAHLVCVTHEEVAVRCVEGLAKMWSVAVDGSSRVAVEPLRCWVACLSYHDVVVRELATGEEVARLDIGGAACAFTPCGSQLAVIGDDATHIATVPQGDPYAYLPHSALMIPTACAVLHDNAHIIAVGERRIEQYNITTGRCVRALRHFDSHNIYIAPSGAIVYYSNNYESVVVVEPVLEGDGEGGEEEEEDRGEGQDASDTATQDSDEYRARHPRRCVVC